MAANMPDSDVKAALDDHQAVFLTMYGEARGDWRQGGTSVEERIAVGCIVRNRLRAPRRFGETYRAVCLARAQFSCWWLSGGAENYAHLMSVARAFATKSGFPILSDFENGLLRESEFLAGGIIAGQILDSIKGATHYYAPDAMPLVDGIKGGPREVPEWARSKTPIASVGSQLFFVVA